MAKSSGSTRAATKAKIARATMTRRIALEIGDSAHEAATELAQIVMGHEAQRPERLAGLMRRLVAIGVQAKTVGQLAAIDAEVSR